MTGLVDLEDAPPALTSEQAAALIGCARGTLWAAARDEGGLLDATGRVVVRPFHVGRALRWPTAQLAALLGVGDRADSGLAEVVPPAPTARRRETTSSGAVDDAS